jgi:Domain of unknown function (DUF6779)
MPRFIASLTLWSLRRIALGAASAALGGAALGLIVFSSSQRQLQLGVLLGLWSALLAAYLIVGRHGESGQTELAHPRPSGAEPDEAAARRTELELELSLRREIEQMLSEQLGSLRAEVAALRAEVVDKLGGQLGLERIGTTRLTEPVYAEFVEFPPPPVELADEQFAERGRCRAQEAEPANVRYQGRRRADENSAARFARADG